MGENTTAVIFCSLISGSFCSIVAASPALYLQIGIADHCTKAMGAWIVQNEEVEKRVTWQAFDHSLWKWEQHLTRFDEVY